VKIYCRFTNCKYNQREIHKGGRPIEEYRELESRLEKKFRMILLGQVGKPLCLHHLRELLSFLADVEQGSLQRVLPVAWPSKNHPVLLRFGVEQLHIRT
jgi:hypothetical protein